MPDWGLTKGGLAHLSPFLRGFEQLNQDYNRRAYAKNLVRAILLYHIHKTLAQGTLADKHFLLTWLGPRYGLDPALYLAKEPTP